MCRATGRIPVRPLTDHICKQLPARIRVTEGIIQHTRARDVSPLTAEHRANRLLNYPAAVERLDTTLVLHYFRVVRNVTVTLPEDVARWARIRAAQENMSVSRFLGAILQGQMSQESTYEAAMRDYLDRNAVGMKIRGDRYPDRERLHDRSLLR